MKAIFRPFTVFIMAIALIPACKKQDAAPPPPPKTSPPSLTTDSSTLAIRSQANSSDSFMIQSGISWTVSVPGDASAWIKTSVLSGSGNSKVLVSTLQDNMASAPRSTVITITPVNAPSVQPVTVTVNQKSLNLVMAWSTIFGSSVSCWFTSIVKTPDGGYIAAGITNSPLVDGKTNHGDMDILVVKVDASGQKQWSAIYGGKYAEEVGSIIATSDGGYAILGTTLSSDGDFSNARPHANTDPDAYVLKIDGTGKLSWVKLYGGTGPETLYSFIQMPDGGYAMAGKAYKVDGDFTTAALTPHGSSNFFLIRTDGAGNIGWAKLYGGSGSGWVLSLLTTPDGGFALVGQYNGTADYDFAHTSAHGNTDAYIIKTDAGGTVNWAKLYGSSNADIVSGGIATVDGGFAIAGGYNGTADGDFSKLTPHNGNEDIYIMKTDGSGNLAWVSSFGGSKIDNPLAITAAANGGYTVCGSTSSSDGDFSKAGAHGSYDVFLIKVDAGGSGQWQKLYGGTGIDDACTLVATTDGGLVLTGSTQSTSPDMSGSTTNHNGWIFKILDQ